jgi:thermostable 8-oxoguanine DNA glycosylase
MQVVRQQVGSERHEFVLPDPDEPVMGEVTWGNALHIFTPAFWAARARAHALLGNFGDFKTGQSLLDEYGHCILGGHGMPAEVGWAAYDRLRGAGVFLGTPSPAEIELLLAQPLMLDGRPVRYRFPKRKAQQIARGLPRLHALEEAGLSDIQLRSSLLELPGVGPKTASWIVRNHRGSDEVAIIDVHIARAGRAAGIFLPNLTPQRHYFEMERLFINFAAVIGVRASILDHMMWNEMRKIGWLLDS